MQNNVNIEDFESFYEEQEDLSFMDYADAVDALPCDSPPILEGENMEIMTQNTGSPDFPHVLEDDDKATILYNHVIQHSTFLKDDKNNHYIKYENLIGKTVRADSEEFNELLYSIAVSELGKVYGSTTVKNVNKNISSIAGQYAQEATIGTRCVEKDGILYYWISDGVVLGIGNGMFYDGSNSDVIFIKNSTSLPQVMPDFNSPAEALPELVRKAFNISPQNMLRFLAQLCCFYLPYLNTPLLILSGGHGTAKSTTAKKVVSLTDPSYTDVSYIPKKEDGLTSMLAAKYIAAFDNVEKLSAQFSNLLCIACTGGYDSKRKLYSDAELVNIPLKCHIIMNGIGDYVSRPDLAERSNVIYHEPLQKRLTEKQIWTEFNALKPALLGSIFNTLRIGLPMVDEMAKTFTQLPRMADFAVHGAAFIKAMGLNPAEFLKEYSAANNAFVGDCAENDDFYALIKEFLLAQKQPWTGKASELLSDLKAFANLNHLYFEKTNAAALSRKLSGGADDLLKMGIVVHVRSTNPKSITLQFNNTTTNQ